MKNIFCLLLLYPFSLFSEVNITTVDDFHIFNTSEHDLVVSKHGDKDPINFLAFRMERPFCICSNPVISLGTDKDIKEGVKINGTIRIDLTKPMDIVLKVLQVFESGHLLLRPLKFPSIRSSKVVEVDLDVGASELFFTNGIDNAMEQSKSMCESDFLFQYVEPKTKEMSV